MADLVPAWAHDGERREPTADEIETGFGCGPFSLPLWNWMFFALWSELGEVITHAGLTPDNGDMTQVRQAIQAMIDASTGGGDPESYLTLLQASARLPVYPEVQNTNGHFGVTSPSTGQVRVPAGVNFLHRGISPYITVQTDLATDASKIYHLRWDKTGGFALKDLASGTYNPSSLQENNSFFDSSYDDMLVARIITNSSNVPTITNLVNRNKLRQRVDQSGAPYRLSPSGFAWLCDYTVTTNWGRTPDIVALNSHVYATNSPDVGGPVVHGGANAVQQETFDRYSTFHQVLTDWNGVVSGHVSHLRGTLGA